MSEVQKPIPFYRPDVSDLETSYVLKALKADKLSGDGAFTKSCHTELERQTGSKKALLTHSGTGALDMAALLLDLKPGDEVIMPSYTFVSTANAFVLRGAVPVFVDSRPDTLNIDEQLIESAITKKTKAICVVHYAGVACEMDTIKAVAAQYRLPVVEDAAQGFGAYYKGQHLGAIGDFGALSFHDTKNAVAGEGGALLVQSEAHVLRAEVIREKGTNRSQFFRGQVDKYTWVDVGSSFLPSELTAALLLAQLERGSQLNAARLKVWNQYHSELKSTAQQYELGLPFVPKECQHNGHLFYLIARSLDERTQLIQFLKENGITAPFHYVPLHNAPAGKKYARVGPVKDSAQVGRLPVCEDLADRLVRFPMLSQLDQFPEYALRVVEAVKAFYKTY